LFFGGWRAWALAVLGNGLVAGSAGSAAVAVGAIVPSVYLAAARLLRARIRSDEAGDVVLAMAIVAAAALAATVLRESAQIALGMAPVMA
ncbi:hypothetical protein ABTM95_19235, partial [Acinetobacter baumannii]